MKATVTQFGRDPYSLREKCEDQINSWLKSESELPDDSSRERLAEQLLAKFLTESTAGNTTGAESLAVEIS